MKTEDLPKTLFSFIWFFLKKHWVALFFMQLCCFAWSIDQTLWPYVIMVLIDTITHYTGDKTGVWQALTPPIIMGISLWITVEVGYRIGGVIRAYIFPRLEANMRMKMFDYVIHHSHRYFSNQMTGTIANKINDMPLSVNRLLTHVCTLFIPIILALIIAVTLFTRISIWYAVILLSWLVIHTSVVFYCAKKGAILSNVHAETRSSLSGKIVDCLSNITNVRLFARNRFEREYLSHFQENEVKTHFRSLIYIEKIKGVWGIMTFIGTVLILNGYMLYSWQQGRLTTGEVVFIFNTTWNITTLAWLAGLELPNVFQEIGIEKQALTLIQEQHEIIDAPHAKKLLVTEGEIVFDHVTFHYQKHHALFQNKTITIEAKQKVGLVGFSGSGKSTFVNLILRYYDIQGGHIFIDGQDIAQVTQNSLHEQISIIPQDPSLFHRSLMENIRYGKLDASDEEVIEAARKAHCHEFIMSMPEKYNTLVGERGIKLSGGQRQRIAIARAILKNAPLLILDEATSALDSITEREIQEGLALLMENKTVLVVAHRLSTLSGMDRILVFHEGQIIEDGSHEQLMAEMGHYSQLWVMQAGGFLPDLVDEEE